MKELGVLRRQDVREVWAREAGEFTPWLAQHLGDLGNVLGMELQLQAIEAPVGEFSVDLLARDLNQNRLVVIENQLESTDHGHLGKMLTYAAGYNAGGVIWVASELREEHRQTLDWLNQHTDAATEFFGVEVEILQVDDSKPAVNFRPVAFPNTWRKDRAVGPAPAVSERGEAYRAFFQQVVDELREAHQFTGVRTAQPQNWCSFASGVGSFSYSLTFGQGKQVRVEIYIDSGDKEWNKRAFDAVREEKALLESELGEPLTWERLDHRRASRIAVSRPGSIEDDAETLESIHRWGIDRLLTFKKVFGPKLRELNETL